MKSAIALCLLLVIGEASWASDCLLRIEERTVRGESMSGLVEAGRDVRIAFGHYDCHDVRRGDIVALRHAGRPDPIIKVARGLPGDRFHLEKTREGWNIRINGRVLKTSSKEPYLFNEKGYRMLSLYEGSYGGRIPPGTYLILGNLAGGSLDSSRFGLISKSEILGKVLIKGKS